ncbi:MAG: pyridoxal phosphate-dependent aminotransferase [Deltaproteobacteria bacterium]|nr:pyridoxal phosphate-dependent aminotransferase [Deltaproteobacteria bacterium]
MSAPEINPIEATYRRLKAAGKDLLKLYSGNPNEQGIHFPGEILQASYSRYFEKQDYFPHPKGLKVARQAISDYYAGQKAEVDPENILLTSGTSESFFYLFSLLTQAGDNVLVPKPAYPLFDSIAELAKIELRHYALREDLAWSIDFADLEAKRDSRSRAVLLVSPNNPTGAVSDLEEISTLVDWANSHDLPLICDEVFSEFFFGEGAFPRPMALTKPKLCFTLNGLSKMLALPGLKLSWIAVTG